MYGKIMEILFPNGMVVKTADDHRLALFVMHIVGKLTRLANSGPEDDDSVWTDQLFSVRPCHHVFRPHHAERRTEGINPAPLQYTLQAGRESSRPFDIRGGRTMRFAMGYRDHRTPVPPEGKPEKAAKDH